MFILWQRFVTHFHIHRILLRREIIFNLKARLLLIIGKMDIESTMQIRLSKAIQIRFHLLKLSRCFDILAKIRAKISYLLHF